MYSATRRVGVAINIDKCGVRVCEVFLCLIRLVLRHSGQLPPRSVTHSPVQALSSTTVGRFKTGNG